MKMRKLKILIVSDAIYPYNKGGKEKRIFEITTRLVRLGHEVHIYCMKWWKEPVNEKVEYGVHLHAISPLYSLYSGKKRSILQAILFSLSCLKLMKENFDVIEVDHMPHLVLFSTKIVAFLKRKKLIATWNEVWGREYWKEYLGILGNIAYCIEWITARLPDVIIAVSKHTKDSLISSLKVKKNIYVVPNGIDLEFINDIKPSKETSDIIFAGRLLSHKNVDVLIQAIALVKKKIPNIKALIIGEGPEKLILENLVEKLHINENVKFLNFLKEQKDLYSLMKSSKIFTFPSTREGFGIAALEANACELPVITVNAKNNATKDLIVNGKNGYVVKLTPEAIAEKIYKILSFKGIRTKSAGNSQVKNYDWTNIVNQIGGIYSQ